MFLPNEFAQAVQEKIPRPFIFGPIEFKELHLKEEEYPFDHTQVRASIEGVLQKTPIMPDNLCIHGFNVTVKNKTLKRRTTIVKHSRFLRNLEVTPVFPPEPEPPVEVAADENENGEEEEDE